jgi:hypothetical protein
VSPDEPKKSKRGGSRKHPTDCKCGKCPVIGRRKTERFSNPRVAEKVLRDVRHELVLKALFAIELHRLGIDLSKADFGAKEAPRNVSIIPLTNLIHRVECRAFGNPMDTVNHLHDKQTVDVNVTFTISERIKRARERAAAQLK